MSSYVTNVRIDGSTLVVKSYDTNKSKPLKSVLSGKTVTFTLDDWNGSDANIYLTRIFYGNNTIWESNEEWWVNGNKSFTIDDAKFKSGYTNTYLSYQDTITFKLVFYFEDGKGSEEFTIGWLNFYAPTLQSLSLNTTNVTKTFYVNSTFNSDNLVVTANYRYQIDGDYTTATISNPSITAPSMTSAGTKSVTVSYGGVSASYDITLYGVKSANFTSLASSYFRKGVDTRSVLFPASVTIVYDDNTTETKSITESNIYSEISSVSMNSDNIGHTYYVKAVASKTDQEVTTTYVATEEAPTSLSITTNPTKRVYTSGESINLSGLVLKSNYSHCSQYTVPSNSYTVSGFNTSTIGSKTLYFIYQNVSTSLAYYVSGLVSATVDLSNVNTTGTSKYYKTTYLYGYLTDVTNDLSAILGKIRMSYVTRTYSTSTLGNYTDSTSIASNSEITVSGSLAKGDNTYTASLTKNSITKTGTFLIRTYKYERLEIANFTTLTYYGSTHNKVEITPDLKVYGIDTDDNSRTELTYGTQYSVSPAVDTTYPLGNTTVRFTSLENGVYVETTVHCDNDAPAVDAYLTPSGSLDKTAVNNKYYYSVGETIDLSGLNLIVSEMLSGESKIITSDNYSKRLYRTVGGVEYDKSSLTFDSNDATGNYTLALSFGNLTPVTYDIVNDYASTVTIDTTSANPTKLVYKAGEQLDLSTIHGIITYASTAQKSIDANDILSVSKNGSTITLPYTFEKSDTTDHTSKTDKLTFNISGVDTDIEFTVICVKSATINLTTTSYKIHDPLAISSIVVTYSDNSTRTLEHTNEKDEYRNIVWKDGANDFDITNMTFANIRTTDDFTLDGTYTEAGVSVSIEEDITIKALKEIRIVDSELTQYSIITLDYNTQIDSIKNTYFVYPIFNDGTSPAGTELITNIYASSNDTVVNTNKLKSRTSCYVRYNWEADTLTGTFTLYCMKLVSINLSWNGLNATHYVDDVINMSTITGVTASYSALEDGEEYDSRYVWTDSDLNYSNLAYTINNQNVENNSWKFTGSGTYTLVAAYKPYDNDNLMATKTLSITVDAVVLQSITVNYDGVSSFIEGQSITANDNLVENLEVTATYNNGNVTLDLEDLSFYELDGTTYVPFVINKSLTTSDTNKIIYVGFGGEYDELMQLVVASKTLSSIQIVEDAIQDEFTIGDTISFRGLVIKATFDNGDIDLIPYNDSNVTYTGVSTTDPISVLDSQTVGTKPVTVSYTSGGVTKTASTSVKVVYPKLKKLRINSSYVTTVYQNGATYSDSGLLVYAVYENDYEEQLLTTSYSVDTSAFVSGSTIAIPIESGKYLYGLTYVPVEATNPYDNTDKITNNKDYRITLVSSSSIEQTWLRFDETIDYSNYNVGDVYDAKGVEMWVRDASNNEFKVNFTTNPALGTLLRGTQRLEVIVSFEGKSDTYTINVNANYSENTINVTDYVIAIGDINGSLIESITHGDTEIETGVKENGETIYPIFKESDVKIDDNTAHTLTYGYNILNDVKSTASSKCIGYMQFGYQDIEGNVIKNAHVVLFDDYVNPISGDGNVIVKYPHYVEGYSDRINKCKFGIIFDKNLFVSGNEKYKNCDWHTQNSTLTQEASYTYFSDLDYCYYGTDDTKVLGYDIYRDGDLVVIKESSRTQATLYRREAKMITAIDSQGNKLEGYYENAYPSFDINFNGGDGGLSNRSIINFMGDTLFLTKNGLKVLSSKDTTYNKEKIVYDVSTYINPRIIKENLEDACLFAFKEKLILKTSRGIYVGEYNLRNTNNEYEWYFLDNIKANLFFEYDDELYFMSDEGEINKFSYNETLFKDNSRTFIGVGGTALSIDETNDLVITSQAYNDAVIENNGFHLIESANEDELIHASLGVFIEERERDRLIREDNTFNCLAYVGLIHDSNNTIEIKPYKTNTDVDYVKQDELNSRFTVVRNLYIDSISGQPSTNAPVVSKAYKLVKYESADSEYLYQLVDSTNTVCDLSQTKQFRISYVISEESITRITNISTYGTGKSFKLKGDHDAILDLINYNNYQGSYKGVITKQDNVEAFYITKPYDMATILYEKTIYQWAIVNDTELSSYMDVGYLTSRKQGDYSLVIKTASGSRAYSYDESKFSFDKIQFTSDKLPHIYNRYRVLASIGFIRFLFKNFEDSNIVLDQLSLIYSISQSIKGVK